MKLYSSPKIFITPDVIHTRDERGTRVPRVIGFWVRFGLDVPPAWVMTREAAVRCFEVFPHPF